MMTILTDVRGVCLSVCLSVCHAAYIGGGACSVRRVLCARGHSAKPLSNYFDRLFIVVQYLLTFNTNADLFYRYCFHPG